MYIFFNYHKGCINPALNQIPYETHRWFGIWKFGVVYINMLEDICIK